MRVKEGKVLSPFPFLSMRQHKNIASMSASQATMAPFGIPIPARLSPFLIFQVDMKRQKSFELFSSAPCKIEFSQIQHSSCSVSKMLDPFSQRSKMSNCKLLPRGYALLFLWAVFLAVLLVSAIQAIGPFLLYAPRIGLGVSSACFMMRKFHMFF